jgi:hypothetical protein
MSSTIQFTLGNNTSATLTTKTEKDKDIKDHGHELNNIELPPIPPWNINQMDDIDITVTAGGHDGKITLAFLLTDSQDKRKIATVECTNLKNPEKHGVLKCSQLSGYHITARGFRNIGDETRLIIVNVYDENCT